MKPYSVVLYRNNETKHFSVLSDADDIEQSLRERFPGAVVEVVRQDNKTQIVVDNKA